MKMQIAITLALLAAFASAHSANWLNSYITQDVCGGMGKTSAAYENCLATACTKYLNMQRNKDGKGSMRPGNSAMLDNAKMWSRNQARSNNIFHQDIGSVKPGGRCGLMAENVAMFMDGRVMNPAAKCAQQWITSPGHYRNMMGPYKHSVCGIVLKPGADSEFYCTQTFSDDCSGGASAPAPPAATQAPRPRPRPPVTTAAPRPPTNRPRPPTNRPRPPNNRPRPPTNRPRPPAGQPKPTLKYKSVVVRINGRRVRLVRVCSRSRHRGYHGHYYRPSSRVCQYCRPKNRRRCISARFSRMLDTYFSRFH